jgi:hypothetical protein
MSCDHNSRAINYLAEAPISGSTPAASTNLRSPAFVSELRLASQLPLADQAKVARRSFSEGGPTQSLTTSAGKPNCARGFPPPSQTTRGPRRGRASHSASVTRLVIGPWR